MNRNRSIHARWFAEKPNCDNWDGARLREGKAEGPIGANVRVIGRGAHGALGRVGVYGVVAEERQT